MYVCASVCVSVCMCVPLCVSLCVWTSHADYSIFKNCKFIISFLYIGTPVIQGPSEVIYRPNEGPIELVCIRNTTAGSTLWRVNGSSAMTSTGIANLFPGHAASTNGINLVVVNATNNTQYICVSFVQGGGTIETDSEPVYLYIAGMLYHYNTCTYVCI